MLSSVLPRSLDWVLAPAGNDEDARRTVSSWVISVAFDFGTVFVDDGGVVLGGMPHPLLAEHIGPLYRRTKPTARSRAVGGTWLYPARLPVSCNARLNQLGRAVQLLMPPFAVERLTVGSTGSGEKLWAAWLDHTAEAGRPALVIAAAADDETMLQGAAATSCMTGGSLVGSNTHSSGNSRATAPAPVRGRGFRGIRGAELPPLPR